MYLPDFDYPMAVLFNITRIAPGKYRAENAGSQQIQGNNIALTLAAADKLVIITEMTEVAYTLVSAKNRQRFMEDYNLALADAASETTVTDDGRQKLPAVIYSVSIEPAKVATGELFLIKAEFSVYNNSSEGTLPVDYYYDIRKQEAVIYRSATKTARAANGEKSVLEISVKAVGSIGDYQVVLTLDRPEGSAHMDGDFSIVPAEEALQYRNMQSATVLTAGTVSDDELLGKWKFVFPAPGTPSPELTIFRENNELVARVSRPNARTHWTKLEKKQDGLVIKSKSADPTGDCWYVVEDVITFNDQMDQMPVRSKILEGSWCVSIGQVFKSTFYRSR